MEILRTNADGELEVMDISSTAMREEILLVLADHGLIYSDTRPADLRADLMWLRQRRVLAEKRGEIWHQLLMKSAGTAFLALLLAGLMVWVKEVIGAID